MLDTNIALVVAASLALIASPGQEVAPLSMAQERFLAGRSLERPESQGSALLPVFLAPVRESGVGWRRSAVFAFGSLFVLLTLILTGFVAYFSGSLGDRVRDKPGFANALRWLTGSVLVRLGVRLTLSDRR